MRGSQRRPPRRLEFSTRTLRERFRAAPAIRPGPLIQAPVAPTFLPVEATGEA